MQVSSPSNMMSHDLMTPKSGDDGNDDGSTHRSGYETPIQMTANDATSTSSSQSLWTSPISPATTMSLLQASAAERTAYEMKQIVDWYKQCKPEDRFTKVSQRDCLPNNALVTLHEVDNSNSTDEDETGIYNDVPVVVVADDDGGKNENTLSSPSRSSLTHIIKLNDNIYEHEEEKTDVDIPRGFDQDTANNYTTTCDSNNKKLHITHEKMTKEDMSLDSLLLPNSGATIPSMPPSSLDDHHRSRQQPRLDTDIHRVLTRTQSMMDVVAEWGLVASEETDRSNDEPVSEVILQHQPLHQQEYQQRSPPLSAASSIRPSLRTSATRPLRRSDHHNHNHTQYNNDYVADEYKQDDCDDNERMFDRKFDVSSPLLPSNVISQESHHRASFSAGRRRYHLQNQNNRRSMFRKAQSLNNVYSSTLSSSSSSEWDHMSSGSRTSISTITSSERLSRRHSYRLRHQQHFINNKSRKEGKEMTIVTKITKRISKRGKQIIVWGKRKVRNFLLDNEQLILLYGIPILLTLLFRWMFW